MSNERAAIAQFDGGLPRASADARTLWLNRNPARSPPGRCCRLAPNRLAMPRCIRAAGKHGTQSGRPRRSPPFQPLESALDITLVADTAGE
jgi:hypothetical protein